MATNYPINPRVRALGKARIDIARRAQTPAEWQKLWKPPAHSFPFSWGESWKQCVEYRVDDFAAEVGFFIDVLGLPVNALDPDYAMFTSPQGDFYFSVVQAEEGTSTPPDAIRLQFMVTDIFATVENLESRGIAFAQQPQAVRPGSTLQIATFLTPHGICIDLWGVVPSHRPTLAAIEDTDEEDIFLPGDETDDDLRLFTTQDADPLHTSLPTPHNAPPILPPAPARKPLHQALPPLIGTDDDLDDDLTDDQEDDLEDDQDDESEFDDLAEEESDQDDDDDIEYVDIDTA